MSEEIEILHFDDAEQVRQFWIDNPDYKGVCDCPSDTSKWSEEMKQAAREAESGIGLTRYESVDEMFEAMGLEDGDE